MFRNLFVTAFAVSLFCANSFAQCDGVYFKTNSWKLFPNEPITIGQQGNFIIVEPKDLTGDGIKDLIGGIRQNLTSFDVRTIKILPATGTGGFGTPIELTFPTDVGFYTGIFIADFNNDGKNDLITILQSNPISALVYKNNGGGSFTPMTISILSSFTYVHSIFDINGDGIADMVTGNSQVEAHYRFGNADGTFNAPVQMSARTDLPPADMNNDGKIDLPFKDRSDTTTIKVYSNQGNGIFFLGTTNIVFSNAFNDIKLKDFNGDGLVDLLAGNETGNFSIFKNLGNNNFARTDYSPPFTLGYGRIDFGDFNGDGFADIFVSQKDLGYSNFYSIFTNNGAGVFTRNDYPAKFRGLPIGDFDGDNKTDLVNVVDYNPFDEPFNIRIFNETQVTVSKNVCNKQGQTKTVDFDNNGMTNKAFWRSSDGRWRYQPDTYPRDSVLFNWGIPGDITTPGDFDGDSKTDYAVYRPSNGVWYVRNSSDGSYFFLQFGLNADKPVAADYDGDGKTDVAVYRPSDGNWYVFQSSNWQVFIVHFGISEDKPAPGDFDGDGKADPAVFRPSTGVWYYLKSSDFNAVAIQWGISTDKPVPADYDGDGKADITVFRESDGNWYFYRSFNSQAAVHHFGAAGDVPQPGDWNGDGIIDAGVYRPGNTTWYSSDSFYSVLYGSSGETPIASILRIE
jgi:hypothetical protein